MKYFAKVTSNGYSAKNKLQESAKHLSKNRDQFLIDEQELPQWKDDLIERIEALNRYFHRCTPLTYSFDDSYTNSKDKLFTCKEVFTITLYAVKNS